MKVHADVLGMTNSANQKELIKWYHARTLFFKKRFGEGLALARECKHPDARFLASLFVDGPPATCLEAAAVFLTRGDEPRCLCWAAQCGGGRKDTTTYELLRLSAEGGYSWGQAKWGKLMGEIEWLEKAAAQGEPQAWLLLGCEFTEKPDVSAANRRRGTRFLFRAARVGLAMAQYLCSRLCCKEGSLQQFQWLRRSVIQGGLGSLELVSCAARELALHERGGTGRFVFEIGSALAASHNWRNLPEFESSVRCVVLFRQWTDDARRGVLCWLWLAREKGVVKDIRLLIADLIWEERAEWSDRKTVEGVKRDLSVLSSN